MAVVPGAFTQSGYPVIASYGSPELIPNPEVPGSGGVKVYGGLRRGSAATVLLYIAARWHKEVEKLQQVLGVWGYDKRSIRGGVGWSNHAGGCAMDLNSSRHPQHVRGTFNRAQVAAIRSIFRDVASAANWGGEWDDASVDEMHAQISNMVARTDSVDRVALAIAAGNLPNVPAELLRAAAQVKPNPVRTPAPVAPPKHLPTKAPAFPLRPGQYYGPLEGPASSISGSFRTDTKAQRQGLATWQARMAHRGWTIAVDGYYGPQTGACARQFQAEKHLQVDGLIGPATWAAAWTAPIT